MDQRSRVHRPAAHRRGHARWRLPMEPCNSSEFCCEDGPGCGAEEKGALWRQWRGNEQAGFEAHRERSRDGGGVSVPGPCGLRTATGGVHPRVGCWVFDRPAAGTGAQTARLLPIGTATRFRTPPGWAWPHTRPTASRVAGRRAHPPLFYWGSEPAAPFVHLRHRLPAAGPRRPPPA